MTTTSPTCATCGSPLAGTAECSGCLFQLAMDVGTVERICAPAFASPEPDQLARLMPEFQFLEPIGQGGMGAVYKVVQTRLDRVAALKVLPPERAAVPGFAERFLREAQALAQLSHPAIVEVYDMGQRGPWLFILMEYVPGRTLREVIRERRLPVNDALRLASELCEALEAAHAMGIVHRDIKPDNVLITPAGRPKLLDFGLVKLTEDSRLDRFTLTEINLRMGTPHYMAPEQMSSSSSVDRRADIYAMGVLLYEMVTGELPALDYTPPSRRVRADPRIDRVVHRAIRESPSERYASAEELRREISHIVTTPRRRTTRTMVATCFISAMVITGYAWYRGATRPPPPPLAAVPFSGDGAREHQQRWAAYLNVPVEWTNTLGMRFVLIPPGEFHRGIPKGIAEEVNQGIAHMDPELAVTFRGAQPSHQVRLTQPLYFAVTETTQAEYQRVMEDNPSRFRKGGNEENLVRGMNTDKFPVERVRWEDAAKFAEKLSEMEGLAAAEGYRLPTEAEWMFAACGGTESSFWYGNQADEAGTFEISAANSGGRPHEVGSLAPNAFGLYDMQGNVQEYAQDWWSEHEYRRYVNAIAVDPTGPASDSESGGFRVACGGHYKDTPRAHDRMLRQRQSSSIAGNWSGFRVVIPARAVKAHRGGR